MAKERYAQMKVEKNGLCIISDRYFDDFPSIRHMSNKHESRPYYLALHSENGIVWVIPLSSQVEKYREKIKADERKYGNCLFYYISKFMGKDSAFLIGNVIPVTDDYIKKPFTIQGRPFVIEDKAELKKIQSKFKRYLVMVRQGKLKPAVDILKIEAMLINRKNHAAYII